MKTYVILFIESTFHCLNAYEREDYSTSSAIVANHENRLVTFQSIEVTRTLKASKAKRLPQIVDLESLDRQMSQQGKDILDRKQWKAITALRQHDLIASNFQLTIGSIRPFLEAIADLYVHLMDAHEDEKARFNEIENYVNRIIYYRQFEGIRVDLEFAKDVCKRLDHEIYEIKNLLQLEHRIFDADNVEEQKRYLISKKYPIIESVRETLRDHRYEDELCDKIYTMIRKQEDLDSFLYMLSHWGSTGRTHPEFHGFGTITSRITMRQPALQNMRRENRKVIIPDKGKRLYYVDYSQFEAGILASLANDDQLIALYNNDIYTDIAKRLLNDGSKRDEAKIVFYRFMYGDGSLGPEAESYFNRFQKLSAFRAEIAAKLEDTKMVGSVNGNFRIAGTKDNSWALSHVIQSTASLVYKSAIVRVHREVPGAAFLIPMHDATLYQLDYFQYKDQSIAINQIYKEEFKKVCPKIMPVVNGYRSFEAGANSKIVAPSGQ